MRVNRSLKYRLLVLFGLALSVGLAPVRRVSADAAPPQAPPGSSIATGDFETNVQMVSEEVVIEVGYYTGEDVSIYSDQTVAELAEREFIWGHSILSTGDLKAHVDATFIMKNQGDQDEAFDVWFPIESDDGYFEIVHVVNFKAWVNGIPSEIAQRIVTDERRYDLLWAIWPATFPVGEEVVIRVSYDIPPTYIGPLREFGYILETGAGWYGAIEEGKFIVRLPYEASSENASFESTSSKRLAIERSDLLISNNEIQWQFTNLEPLERGNIRLSILEPSIWEEIQTARSIATANPDSLDAQLRLIHALEDALLFHHGLSYGWNFAREAKTAYEHALVLAPEDIDIYVGYLDLLLSWNPPVYPPPEEFLPTLEHALELAPEDTRLLELKDTYQTIKKMFLTTPSPTIQPSPSSTLTEVPSPSPTAFLSPTPRPTQTPAPTDRPVVGNISQSPAQGVIIPVVVVALAALLGMASRLFMHQIRQG